MPELPEVETIVRQLRGLIVGQEIIKIQIRRPDQWKQNHPQTVARQLKGRQIVAIKRRAKFIVIEFENECQLLIHLRMTGKLIWFAGNPEIDKQTRTILFFKSGGSLAFNDTRALGRLTFFACARRDSWQQNLGLEPLGDLWTLENLTVLIKKSKLDIKSFLLDQKKIAGIGNIYASEILFRSKIKPQRRTDSLSPAEIEQLYLNIPEVLQLAIANMGTSLGDGKQNFRSVYSIEGEFQKLIKVYDRKDLPCFDCGAPIQRIRQKQRSSYFCDVCQK